MSRIGKQIIEIPQGVTVDKNGGEVIVSGPRGKISRIFKDVIDIKINDNQITLVPVADSILAKNLWGTYGSHLKNMVVGVTEGFVKKLVIEGIGYKINVTDGHLVLDVGFSHQVRLKIPADLEVTVEKNNITVSGYNKESVGGFASLIRIQKKTEPYKGKGIRYIDEVVLRKQGKKSVA
ncbi:MAG: 50S ribosomal protein L6 [Patescibacteria group bacterium]